MSEKVEKAYEIKNARISFVSLVNKAANKRTFLILKEQEGSATFNSFGPILKTDSEGHYVTGVVYEPMAEDTQGNFMTEEEIIKAAHWFMKNGNKVDLQHSFMPLTDARVVESWVAKADTEINGQTVKKGTWLMTVEVNNKDVWDSIQKGELTGFSMGGVGDYSTSDVQIAKSDSAQVFADAIKNSGLFAATELLNSLLRRGGGMGTQPIIEDNPDKVAEILDGFTAAVTALCKPSDGMIAPPDATPDSVVPAPAEVAAPEPGLSPAPGGESAPAETVMASAEPVRKAGKALSRKNLETLQSIRTALQSGLETLDGFVKGFEPAPESEDVEGQEGGEPQSGSEETAQGKGEAAPVQASAQIAKGVNSMNSAQSAITPAGVEAMVSAAIQKALQVEPATAPAPAQMTEALVKAIVEQAVAKAVEPILKARGLPTNLNDSQGVRKQEQHYLHGIL